ncbi:uncharacterized protein RBU33_022614 isoform 1-T6 [Hipposideros larvatus]
MNKRSPDFRVQLAAGIPRGISGAGRDWLLLTPAPRTNFGEETEAERRWSPASSHRQLWYLIWKIMNWEPCGKKTRLEFSQDPALGFFQITCQSAIWSLKFYWRIGEGEQTSCCLFILQSSCGGRRFTCPRGVQGFLLASLHFSSAFDFGNATSMTTAFSVVEIIDMSQKQGITRRSTFQCLTQKNFLEPMRRLIKKVVQSIA